MTFLFNSAHSFEFLTFFWLLEIDLNALCIMKFSCSLWEAGYWTLNVKVLYLDVLTMVGLRWFILIGSFIFFKCMVLASHSLNVCVKQFLRGKGPSWVGWPLRRTSWALTLTSCQRCKQAAFPHCASRPACCPATPPQWSTCLQAVGKNHYLLPQDASCHTFGQSKEKRKKTILGGHVVAWVFRTSVAFPGLPS